MGPRVTPVELSLPTGAEAGPVVARHLLAPRPNPEKKPRVSRDRPSVPQESVRVSYVQP